MTEYIRFSYKNSIRYGILIGNKVEVLKGTLSELKSTGEYLEISEVEILSPSNPSKVICTGLNYSDTVLNEGDELPIEPLLFLKAPSAIVKEGENIEKTGLVKELVCEAELALVISKGGKNIKKEDAYSHVLGYIVANDVTAKDLQKKDGQWARSKSFDSFLPLSSRIVSNIDPTDLNIKSSVNGKVVQEGNTRDMIFNVPYLINYISQAMTLNEGDIILTGTPGGFGKSINEGDIVNIEIEQVGSIKNIVSK